MRILIEINNGSSFGKALLKLRREFITIRIREVFWDIEIKQLAVCISYFISTYINCNFTRLLRIKYEI